MINIDGPLRKRKGTYESPSVNAWKNIEKDREKERRNKRHKIDRGRIDTYIGPNTGTYYEQRYQDEIRGRKSKNNRGNIGYGIYKAYRKKAEHDINFRENERKTRDRRTAAQRRSSKKKRG